MGLNHSTQNKSISKAYIFTYGTIFVAVGLSAAAFGPMLPYLAAQTQVSLSQIGLVFTATSFGYLLGSVGGGRLYDRFPGHRLMRISLAFSIVPLNLIPLTSKIFLFLTILFILGIAHGILDVGANTSLLWAYKADVGPYMNALHFCFGAGSFLAPLIMHCVLQWSGGKISWPFWSLAFLTLPGMLGLWMLPSIKNEKTEAEELHSNRLKTGLLIAIILLFFATTGVEAGFGGWIFTYVTKANIINETGAALLNALFWGTFTLGRLLSVPYSRKIKTEHILLGSFAIAIVSLLVLHIFSVNSSMIWIGSATLGLALSAIFPTLLVLSESRLKITGRITGLLFLGSSLGTMLVPMALGHIYEIFGRVYILSALLALAGMGLCVLLLVVFFQSITKNKQKIE